MVGVVTNGNHGQQSLKAAVIGLEPLLDVFFSSGHMGYAKPAGPAFLLPCEHLNLSPGQVLYVGDNYSVDVEGARNAGLHAVHLDRTTKRQLGALRSLAELIPFLDVGAPAALP